MSYKSPIEIIQAQMRFEQENGIYKAIQEQGINVDKDELIRALKYDRAQYEKGYQDGLSENNLAMAETIRAIRADAIFEFASRLKKYYSSLPGKTSTVLATYHIDQIAQEMTKGKSNEEKD